MEEGKRKRVRKVRATEDTNTSAYFSLNAQRHRHGSSAKEVENAKPGAIPYVQSTETRKEQQSKHHEEKLVPTLSFYDRTNPHKPSALPSLTASQPRQYTISIALPGSIILNAQTPELQSRLAGHIARSCAIFNVDEIIVFDDHQQQTEESHGRGKKQRFNEDGSEQPEESHKGHFDPNAFLARILQYVETPQYLRKALFPMHRDLRLAGLLAPLDCPHHLRYEDQSPFREGICVDAPHWAHDQALCWVNVGLRDPIGCFVKSTNDHIGRNVPKGARVTVKMPRSGKQQGELVSPRAPVEERGIYWGYTVRLCDSLANAIGKSGWNEQYDLVIGTSERGQSLSDVLHATMLAQVQQAPSSSVKALPPFKHALIVLGGLSGLEVAIERDEDIPLAADNAHQLFDAWVNIVEGQGSRTIRTEVCNASCGSALLTGSLLGGFAHHTVPNHTIFGGAWCTLMLP